MNIEQKQVGWLARWWETLRSRIVAARTLTPDQIAVRLDTALRDATTRKLHSGVMWVDAPRHGIQQGFAHGVAHVADQTPMTVETPFVSASTGKLVVAAAVFALAAQGRLSLQDPIVRYVPMADLAGLPVEGGDAALAQVTIAMLLSHRSGLPDYFSEKSRDGAPRLFDLMASEPQRTWSRAQLLDYARDHYAPAGAPGRQFHYADTNYDLLGMVLEGVTGQPFHKAVRTLVLDPLGLGQTYYHAFEAAPADMGKPADVWVGKTNLWGAASMSADQAGGGLVTTVADLRTLIRGLVDGRPVPLSLLAADFTENAMHAGIDVGLGAWRIRPRGVFFALGGLPNLVGHSGATGVWAYYVPDWDAVLVGAVSDASWQAKHIEYLLRWVLPVMARGGVGQSLPRQLISAS